MAQRLLLMVTCLACILSLSSCSEAEPVAPARTVDLTTDVLANMKVLDVQRVDTDSDGELEWLVFYRFDQVGERGPVAAIVYDVGRYPAPQLPVLFPFKLRTPDQNYLSQGQPKVLMVDILPETDGTSRKEMVFSNPGELAIFRVTRNPGGIPTDDPPLYHCVGFFRGEAGVNFDPENKQVMVTNRAGLERSQLVTRYYYRPHTDPAIGDGYFITGTYTLLSPAASRIDFPDGIPAGILDTPYPEKIVLAFYQTFGRQDAKPTIDQYFTPAAATEFVEGRLKYGSPYALNQIRSAVVKELSYYPTQEDSTATVVIAKVVFNTVSATQSPLIEVRWRMVRIQNQWKMDSPQP